MGYIVRYGDMPEYDDNPIQHVEGDCTSSPLLLIEDRDYTVPLTFTPDEFTKLFSSLSAGAALLYPQDQLSIISILLESVDCMPEICDVIADCILNSPAVQQALNEVAKDWGSEGENGENPPKYEENPTLFEDCDLDNLFGACLQMVQLFNRVIRDVFEIIEVASNQVEGVSNALGAIPGLNLVADALEFVDWLQETLFENYDAAYTVTLEAELACALFCAARETCTLDFQLMADIFADLVGQDIIDVQLQLFLDFFTGSTFTGNEFVYAGMWFVAGMISYGGSILDISVDKLLKLTGAFLNDPNPDWSFLCDCPSDWSHELTGSALQDAFTPFAGRAVWSTDGWVIGALSNGVQLNSGVFTETHVNSIQMIYSGEPPSGGSSAYQFWEGNISGSADQAGSSNTWLADRDLTQYGLSMGKATGTYTGKLVQVNISGFGTDPYA